MEQLAEETLRRGHRTIVVTCGPDERAGRMHRAGAQMHFYPTLELTPRTSNPAVLWRHLIRSASVVRRVAALARHTGADLVCCNGENMFLMPFCGQLAKRPAVTIVRGARFAELPIASRLFFAVQSRWVARYVAVSRTVRDLLPRLGVCPQKISLVPNGVDVGRFSPGRPPDGLAAGLGIPAGAIVIGDVARIVPRKGLEYGIRAVAALVGEFPQLYYLLVGEHDVPEGCLGELERLASDLGVRGRILFAGHREDVPECLCRMAILLHPSETENCPRSVLEAQACSLPVVGFSVGGMGDIVQDGRSGYLAPAFDVGALASAVRALLLDPEKRREMGEAGRAMVLRSYDARQNVSALVDVLEDAASRT